MFRALLALSLVSLAAAQGSQAQQDTTGLVPGRRIRIHQQGNSTVVGSFVSLDAASLAMVTGAGDTVQVSRDHIVGLDLSQGTKSKAGKGAVTGLLVGGLGGMILGWSLRRAADRHFSR